MSQEIERSILTGAPKTGRNYCFSSFPVQGSWRGRRSGVQILPAPDSAPRAAGADNPFILEFPIKGSDLFSITKHRRRREHRKLTLLLNALLAGRTSCPPQRHAHFWAGVLDEAGLTFKWVFEGYDAPLDAIVLDEPSPPAAERLQEIESEEYYTKVANDGRPLPVPADLDESICHYLFGLSADDRTKFDRATFWLDMFSRQWTVSVSAAFGTLVSAIEALTERGVAHQFDCPICSTPTQHEVPGATRRFKDFIERYAPGAIPASRRDEMYGLRSGISHGTKLIELDYALAFGWDPPWLKQRELIWDLATITRIGLRTWLKSKSTENKS